jgi:hypothetical protein
MQALGLASGVFNTARQLGGVFGVAILAAVFSAGGSYASPDAFRDGVAPALGVAAGLAVLGAIAGSLVPAKVKHLPVEPQPLAMAGAGVS